MQTYTFNSPGDKFPCECFETIHVVRGGNGWCIHVGEYDDSPNIMLDRLNTPTISETEGWHYITDVNFINEKIKEEYVYVISESLRDRNYTVILLAFFNKLVYTSRDITIMEMDDDPDSSKAALMAIPRGCSVKFRIGEKKYFFKNENGQLIGPEIS